MWQKRSLKTLTPCAQVSCCGVLVTGAGYRYSHYNCGGDCGDLGTVSGAGCAGGNWLQHGHLWVQEHDYVNLHAATQDALHDCEYVHVCLQCVMCICLHVNKKGRWVCESLCIYVNTFIDILTHKVELWMAVILATGVTAILLYS